MHRAKNAKIDVFHVCFSATSTIRLIIHRWLIVGETLSTATFEMNHFCRRWFKYRHE